MDDSLAEYSIDHVLKKSHLLSHKAESFEIEEEIKPIATGINLKGVFFAVAWNVLWASNPAMISYVHTHNHLQAYEMIYWKSIFMNVANFLFAKYYYKFFRNAKDEKGNPLSIDVFDIPKECRFYAAVRAINGAGALWCYFGAIMYIPVSKASILFFTAPLYMPFLGKMFLNEHISKVDVLALIWGFWGTVFINNPFSEKEKTHNEIIGTIIALLGGMLSSTAWIGKQVIIFQLVFSSTQCKFWIS